MGFSIGYQLTEPVTAETEAAMLDATKSLRAGRTWLSCEPPFLRNYDGVLSGSSKPNFTPHPDDAASAESEGLPDGTLNDLLEILCQLSRQFNVDWEISHDYSDAPLGYIRGGDIDDDVRTQCEAFNDLAGDLGMEGFDLDGL
jgi:hypothetical protein